MVNAYVNEVFSSVQGEGPRIGERHVFVRFLGCDLRCRYCDTPEAVGPLTDEEKRKNCHVQKRPGSFEHEEIANPLEGVRLSDLCSRLSLQGLSRPTLSLTGGEPLLQREFLSEWLPQIREKFSIYLETAGVRHEAMRRLKDLVDVVSMDFKLPSATGLRPYWEEHRKFLSEAVKGEVFIKVVVTGDTVEDDVLTAARIIAETDSAVPLIIQPAGGPFAPEPARLLEYQEKALGMIRDVRVIPQAHRILNVP